MRLLAVAALCLSVSPVLADEAPQGSAQKCGPVEQIAAAKARGVALVKFDDKQRERAITAFNHQPPETDLKVNEIYIVEIPDGTLGFIFVPADAPSLGCVMRFNGQGRKMIMEAIENGTPS